MVLEPDLHLHRRETYDRGEVLSLWRRQVSLLPETPLELIRLGLGKEHAAFPLFRGITGLCRSVSILSRFVLWRVGVALVIIVFVVIDVVVVLILEGSVDVFDVMLTTGVAESVVAAWGA